MPRSPADRLRTLKVCLMRAGLLMAVLSLVSLVSLGAVVLPDTPVGGDLAALAAAAVQCDGSHHGAPSGHTHHGADPALCPLSVALAVPFVVATPAPVLPEPSVAPIFRERAHPPGRGPPAPTARVGAPRAPPFTA